MRAAALPAVCCLLLLSLATPPPARARVVPPLTARLVVQEEPTVQRPGLWQLRVEVSVPEGQEATERLSVALTTEGAARVEGPTEWSIGEVVAGKTYARSTAVAMGATGFGSVRLQVDAFGSEGARLWGRTDQLFFLRTANENLVSTSSYLKLEQVKLYRERLEGSLTERTFEMQQEKLLEGDLLAFERSLDVMGPVHRLQSLAAPPPPRRRAAVAAATVSGRIGYTQRLNRVQAQDSFAAPADALPVRRVRVRFFDQAGPSERELITDPAEVRTADDGTYSARVPGRRADGTAVRLVVRIQAENPACQVGLLSPSRRLHFVESAPLEIRSSAHEVSLTVWNRKASPHDLGAFSILDVCLTARDFVEGVESRTGVGSAPTQLFVNFPGAFANEAFYQSGISPYMNVGTDYPHDWDVLTHEYGHYVQDQNGFSGGPGNCHYIDGNNAYFDQGKCPDPGWRLSKAEGIALAWDEGWPTYFGIHLQAALGLRGLGIFEAGDRVYTDTGQIFSYDLETNDHTSLPAGEDNEVSVFRILWDFTDGEVDAGDELAYGFDALWKGILDAPAALTLDAFRAKMAAVGPPGAALSPETLAVLQGRIYGNLGVGPEPRLPADGAVVGTTPPEFRWARRGAALDTNRPPPGYRFETFRVRIFEEGSGAEVFTSQDWVVPGGAVEATWTPSPEDWASIRGSGNRALRWAVEGWHRASTPTTGPYRGRDHRLLVR